MKRRSIMKKRILTGVFTAMLALAAAGCTSSSPEEMPEAEKAEQETEQMKESAKEQEQVTINVGVPTAPPALPVLYMAENHTLGENVEINIDIWDEPETLLAMVQDGSHDMYAFPLTVISKLYNKGMDMRLMNVNTWGVTYFMTTDESLTDWSDLKGKTVYVPLQSSPPDALTQYFFAQAGLKVGEDVTIVYASGSEIASLVISGEAQYATVLEPQVTKIKLKNENARVAFSFEEEWQKVTGTETKIPNAGFGTSQTFIDENPELTAEFQEAYQEACVWVNEHPKEAGELAEKYLGLEAAIVEQAIPSMGLEFVTASDAKEELQMFYQLLYNFDKTMIGGEMPDEGMYYTGE